MKERKYPNLLCFLEEKSTNNKNNVALGLNTKFGWKELTYGGISFLAQNIAAYFIEQNIQKGEKISIISESNPEWAAVLFGSVLSGTTLVPLDIKLTIYEMKSILLSCEPKILIVSNKFIEFAKQLKEEINSIQEILIINETSSDKTFKSIYELENHKQRKWRHRGLNQTALIIYTSGTTGNPKGVEITYKNMFSQVKGISKCFPLKKQDTLLSILPMNHLFELSVGFLTFLNLGVTIYYPQNLKPDHILYILKEKQISFMVVVPAFLKLIKTEIENDISKRSKIYQMYFKMRYKLAKYIPIYKIRRLMFHSITKKLGGKFKGCISGGAPLDLKVAKFINRMGIEIFEGYGLSEASPVISMSTKKYNKLGYVGKALDGVVIKTDDATKELLVKGDNVMKGYYKQPELTSTVIDKNGWLHTGDIAQITKDGYLKITGRIKNMIVLSGGKKVFPEEVEAVLSKSLIIKEVCVLGTERNGGQKDGTESVTAVIVPKSELYENNQNVEQVIRKEIKELSLKLAQYKRPTKIVILKELLPRTATSKIKRKEVLKLITNK